MTYLTLFGLKREPRDPGRADFPHFGDKSNKRKCCQRQILVKKQKCYTNLNQEQINFLNSKSMGSHYKLQLDNIFSKNDCYDLGGNRLKLNRINCEQRRSLLGNSCQADYVRVIYTCRNKANSTRVPKVKANQTRISQENTENVTYKSGKVFNTNSYSSLTPSQGSITSDIKEPGEEGSYSFTDVDKVTIDVAITEINDFERKMARFDNATFDNEVFIKLD